MRPFKKGLGGGDDAVERHAERMRDTRRDKRDARLRSVRKMPATDGVGFARFSLAEFMETRGAPHTLSALDATLRHADDAYLDQHICEMVFASNGSSNGEGEPVLVHALAAMVPDPVALDCLVNLTGIITRESPKIALALLRNGFMERAPRDVVETWMVAANIMCLCEESRDALLLSALFSPVESAPFTALLARPPGDHTAEMALRLCAFMFDTQLEMPPLQFVPPVFQYARATLEAGQNEEGDVRFLFALETLESVLAHMVRRHRELCAQLVPPAFVAFLVRLLPRIRQATHRTRVCKLLVSVGMLDGVRPLLSEAGAVPLMVMAAQDAHPLVCREAVLWLANFMTDDLDAVEECVARGAFQPLLNALRGHAPHAMLTAIVYAYYAACKTCLYYFQHQVGAQERASGLLTTIVVSDATAIRHLNDLSGVPGNERITLDVFGVWHTLLLWNWTVAYPLLDAHHVLSRVEDALGSSDRRVYCAAEEITQLCSRMDGEDYY